MFTENEQEYLRVLVARELKRFKENERVIEDSQVLRLLKGAHEYEHFLEGILEKLK